MADKDISSASDNGKAGAAANGSSQVRPMVTRSKTTQYIVFDSDKQARDGNASPEYIEITRDQSVNAVKPLTPESEGTQDKINGIQQLPVLREVPSTSNKATGKRKPGPRKAKPPKLIPSPTLHEASSPFNLTYSKARPSKGRLSPDVTFCIPVSPVENNSNNETHSDEMEDEIISILSSTSKSMMEPTSGGKQNPENNSNLETQSQEHKMIVKYLECHFCRKFSVSPIKSCINSHIICGPCMESRKMLECIICKSRQFFPCLIGEKMAQDAAVKVKCRNVAAGCDQIMLSTKARDHLKRCYYREVECHEYSNVKCRGEKIPLLEIPKHYDQKHGIPTSEDSKISLNLLHGEIIHDSAWACGLMHFDDKYFMSHAVAANQKFYAWLTILGSPEQAEHYQSKVILGEPQAPNHIVPKRIKLQKFVFKLPVYPHHDFPRFAICKETKERQLTPLTELISLETLQKWSVSRDEIRDERSSQKYSFKLGIQVMKADQDE